MRHVLVVGVLIVLLAAPSLPRGVRAEVLLAAGGSPRGHLGAAVARVGDVNGDGLADLLVGAPDDSGGRGAAYLFFGRARQSGNLTATDANVSIQGPVDLGGYAHLGRAVAGIGDFNGDGLPDFALGAPGDLTVPSRVYIFFGRTLWSASYGASQADFLLSRPFGTFGAALAAAGDLNGDGRSDLAVGEPGDSSDGQVGNGRTWIFQGNTTLGPAQLGPVWRANAAWDGPDVGGGAAPSAGDLDGNGDVDLLIGGSTGIVHGIDNVGGAVTPRYLANTSWDWSSPSVSKDAAPGLVDINGDGLLDLYVGDPLGVPRCYLNSGTKTAPAWTAQAALDLPAVGDHAAPAFADLNGDGLPDALVGDGFGNVNGVQNIGSRVSPVWSRVAAWGLTIPDTGAAPALADLDLDGRIDLLVGGTSGVTFAYRNVGTRTSPVWARWPSWDVSDVGFDAHPVVVDLDNDGDPDLLVGRRLGDSVALENVQRGYFSLTGPSSGGGFGSSLAAVGDVNGDGLGDLVVGVPGDRANTGEVMVVHGNATGIPNGGPRWFRSPAWDGLNMGVESRPTLVDMDGDGRVDLMDGDKASTVYGFRNNGTVTSPVWVRTPAWDISTPETYATPAFWDLDGDGDLDALVGQFKGGTLAYKNTGTVTSPVWTRWPAWDIPVAVSGYAAPAIADLNGDGLADVEIGQLDPTTPPTSAWAFRNVGSASSPSWVRMAAWDLPPVTVSGRSFNTIPGLGDLDHDGDVDAIVGSWADGSAAFENVGGPGRPMWRYRGQWNLPDIGNGMGPSASFMDLDGDGMPDLLMGDAAGVVYGYLNAPLLSWIRGDAAGARFGASVAGGNFNGDALGDVLVGAPGANATRGEAFLFPGKAPWYQRLNASSARTVVEGLQPGDRLGSAVALEDDFNGDGLGDLALGAPGNDDGGTDAGAFYVLFAPPPAGRTLVLSRSYYGRGEAAGDGLGSSLAFLGEMDNDTARLRELAVGAPNNGKYGAGAGRVYVHTLQTLIHFAWSPDPLSVSYSTSARLTLSLLNGSGQPATLGSADTVFLSTTSPSGRFHPLGQSSVNITSIVLPAGQSSVQLEYSDPNVGAWVLRASDGVRYDGISTAVITPGPLASVALSPWPNATIMAGTPRQLVARPLDSLGHPIPMGVNFTWALQGNGGLSSTTANATFFTAQRVGQVSVTVTATQGTRVASNTTVLTVIPGPLANVKITPGGGPMVLNSSRNFTAQAEDVYGNPIPAASYTWNLFGPIGSLNTTVGPGVRLAAAAAAGNGTLNVTSGAATSFVRIQVLNAKPPSVTFLTPAAGSRAAGVVNVTYLVGPDVVGIDLAYTTNGTWRTLVVNQPPTGFYRWNSTVIRESNVTLSLTAHGVYPLINVTNVVFHVDNVPPWVRILTPPNYSKIQLPYTITFAVSDGSTVSLLYNDGSPHLITTVAASAGSASWLLPRAYLAGVTLTAVVQDDVGLTGSDSHYGITLGTPPATGDAPPTIAGVPNLVVRYNVSYSFDFSPYINDPDTPLDRLTLTSSDPDHIWTDPGNNLALFVNYPGAYLNRTIRVTLWVSDGTLTSFAVINITVSRDYPPFVQVRLPDVILVEDTVKQNVFFFVLSYYFADVDRDNLYYTSGNRSIKVVINQDLSVDMWGDTNWSGTEFITVRATDPTGAIAEQNVVVNVLPVPDPPAFLPLPLFTVEAGRASQLDLDAFVVDSDSPRSSLSLSTPDGRVRPRGLNLTLLYGEGAGDVEVPLTVSDGGLNTTAILHVQVISHWYYNPWTWLPVAGAVGLGVAFLLRRRRRDALLLGFLVKDGGEVVWAVKGKGAPDLTFEALVPPKGRANLPSLQPWNLGDYQVGVLHRSPYHVIYLALAKEMDRASLKAASLLASAPPAVGPHGTIQGVPAPPRMEPPASSGEAAGGNPPPPSAPPPG